MVSPLEAEPSAVDSAVEVAGAVELAVLAASEDAQPARLAVKAAAKAREIIFFILFSSCLMLLSL